MEGFGFWALAVLAAVVVGMSKGGLPVVGMLGVPILSLAISPVTAAGLLLPVYVLSDMFGLYAYRHAFDRRVLAILMAGVTIGVGLGWATAKITPEWAVTALVGLIGAVFSLRLLMRRKDVDHPVDGLHGTVRVQGSENQVAGLGCGQSQADGFKVA